MKMRWRNDYPVVRMPHIKLRWMTQLYQLPSGFVRGIGALEIAAWGYPRGMYAQVKVKDGYWPMVGLN
jgi:hypothetical protein